MSNQNVDLKRAGLKVTLPRLNILSILSESADEGAHLSAEDVYQRLRDAGDDVGLATVSLPLARLAVRLGIALPSPRLLRCPP